MIAVSGVRSSWFMRVMNSLLVRFADSAASFAERSADSTAFRSAMSCQTERITSRPLSRTGVSVTSTGNSPPSERWCTHSKRW
jgi:hypothetical protein